MDSVTLRKQINELHFKFVHLDYLLALAETESGPQLLADLIEVYLERAPRILFWINSSVQDLDSERATVYLRQLASASERLGARHLSEEIKRHMESCEGELFEPVFLTNIFNEFAMVKYELDVLALILHRVN